MAVPATEVTLPAKRLLASQGDRLKESRGQMATGGSRLWSRKQL